ncbi:acyl-CoA dehydrogenase family protein [Saccharomonospora sp. NPDC006951]
MTRTQHTASSPEPVSVSEPAFEEVLANVALRREEFTVRRHVPRDMIDEFKRAGIYRAATPKRFGGDALPPADFLGMIERISEVDASAGWVASFGSATTYLAALPLATQERLFADGPDLAFAGGLFPLQPAERVDGGFLVNGTWRFASGCKGADVLGVGIGPAGDGSNKPRTAILRQEDVTIVENWDVVGLEGTGSHDLRVENVVVDQDWTFIRGGEATVDEPLYRYPTVAYAAQVLAVVNLGVARAALDYAIRVGAGRKGITGAPKPADRPYYRSAVATAEARLRSARAFFYETTGEVYASIVAGDPATDEQIAMLRLAAAHVAKTGFAVVRAAYEVCGTSAIYSANEMQRHLRDASVVVQHAFLSEGMYDGAGAVLMGLTPFPGFL